MLGIVVFAFGLEPIEPSSSNIRLATAAIRISRECEEQGEKTVTSAQWECALAIPGCQNIIWPYLDRYLSTADVVRESALFLQDQGVTRVVAVAKPGIHLRLARRLLRKAGFEVVSREIEEVPYNDDSLQSWTHSAFAFYLHALKRACGFKAQLIITDQMRHLATDSAASS